MIDGYIQLTWMHAGVAEHVQVAWYWNILQEHFNRDCTGKSQGVNIFAPLLLLLPSLLQMSLSFLQSLLNEEAKHVCEGVHTQEPLEKS